MGVGFSMISLKNKIYLKFFLLIILLSIGVLLTIGWFYLNTPLLKKGNDSSNLVIERGTTLGQVASKLKRQGLLENSFPLVLVVRLQGAERNLVAGEYLVTSRDTILSLVRKITTGKVVQHPFTIIEGWTFQKIRTALENNSQINNLLGGLTDDELMKKIGHEGEHPEGIFAPDTYFFNDQTSDVTILKMAYDLMSKRLSNAWDNRKGRLPYRCEYEALIVASLIEKETADETDKFLVASVIVNRLNRGMLLQVDPAVIYGLADSYKGILTKSELMKNTPYNTYLYKGLPPTPICMPGAKSIEAALNPEASNYLFYVSRKDGTHEFSSNLTEQNRAVKKYLLNRL